MSEAKKDVKTEAKKDVKDLASGPLTEEEVKKNAQEEDRKTMRVIQVVQHVEHQKIEVMPIQNISFRSDVIGILTQALDNYCITDITQNEVMLLRETVGLIGGKIDALLGDKKEVATKDVSKSEEAPK